MIWSPFCTPSGKVTVATTLPSESSVSVTLLSAASSIAKVGLPVSSPWLLLSLSPPGTTESMVKVTTPSVPTVVGVFSPTFV